MKKNQCFYLISMLIAHYHIHGGTTQIDTNKESHTTIFNVTIAPTMDNSANNQQNNPQTVTQITEQQNLVTLYQWLKRLKLIYILPVNTKRFAYTQERLNRLIFVKNLFLA